jgi:hypothetical protein
MAGATPGGKRRPAGLAAVIVEAPKDETFRATDSTFKRGEIEVSRTGAVMVGDRSTSGVSIKDLVVVREMGAGACGTVRAARHRVTGEMFAIKCFNLYDKSKREQFIEEITMLFKNDWCAPPYMFVDGCFLMTLCARTWRDAFRACDFKRPHTAVHTRARVLHCVGLLLQRRAGGVQGLRVQRGRGAAADARWCTCGWSERSRRWG